MDVLILMAIAAFGFMAFPPLIVIIGAALLTALSARRKIEIARGYPQAGTGRILAGALFLSLANNTVFGALSFMLGRAVARII